MNRVTVVVLVSLAAPLRLAAQDRAVTLAEAIKLAERTQPGVVQAQRRTSRRPPRSGGAAGGAFLPTVSANSSASDFFSEGASRIDPITGQVLSGNSTNRSLNASLRASVDVFTGFRRGAEMNAAQAGENQAAAGWWMPDSSRRSRPPTSSSTR